MKTAYEQIQIGDRIVCNVMSNGSIVPVEHIVTKTGWDLYGIRTDTNKEVHILGASILYKININK